MNEKKPKGEVDKRSSDLYQKLQTNIPQVLKRAEDIKTSLRKNTTSSKASPSPDSKSVEQNLQNLAVFNSDEDNESPVTTPTEINATSSRAFTNAEIAVLRRGSVINSRHYVPFFPEIDRKEKFFFPIAYSDKEGKLALSDSQQGRFSHWSRPDECFENPTLMMLVSSMSVKQTCISDCSFVASLTVCAQYERKFGTSLLSK